ncbi:MAG: DUF4465 domain-containing protein [Planctomycetia bacterium]|nr:DUF4465 domain-containing protein [Planctomycetia bacterium]
MRLASTWFLFRAAVVALALAAVQGGAALAWTMGFEEFTVDGESRVLGSESYYCGYDTQPSPANETPEVHPFVAGGVTFYNSHGDYTGQWGPWSGWDGWSVSNRTDTTTPGFGNQYSAITGGGVFGSANYAVGYFPDEPYEDFRRLDIAAASTQTPGRHGFFLTNTTYAYLTIRDGDSYGFTDRFTRENNDFFRLEITGLDASGGTIVGLDPVHFYLADFRQSREPGAIEGDYIVNQWTWVDLANLVEGGAAQLRFAFASSDTGEFGINTPLYVAMDSAPVPEPAVWMLIAASGACLPLGRRFCRRTIKSPLPPGKG